MLNILATGTLVAEPRSRQGNSGKSFVTTSMRVPVEGGDAVLVSVIAFSSTAIDALLALTKGDAVAIAGRAKLTSWTKDDGEHHGLSVIADQVLTVYEADRRRKRAQDATSSEAA